MSKQEKGKIAEFAVAARLAELGYTVLFPVGESKPYDLVAEKGGIFIRIQCKYTSGNRDIVCVRTCSMNQTNRKHYTKSEIDYIAAFDAHSRSVLFVPAEMLGEGKWMLNFRHTAAKNNQTRGIHYVADYLGLTVST